MAVYHGTRRLILPALVLLAVIGTGSITAPTTFRPARQLDARRRLDQDNQIVNNPHLLRLNFGLAGVKARTVCIVDGYWTHTFRFELPLGAGNDLGVGPGTLVVSLGALIR